MMVLPIEHESFSGRGLALRSAGFLKGPRILIDGAEAKRRGLKYSLPDNEGNEVQVRLKSNGFDPVPKVDIAGETIELVRPLTWYEYLWMSLPILLVVSGGALGVLFGLFAIYSSARIFRADYSMVTKYGLSAVVSLGAGLAFFACVVVLQLIFSQPATD